MSFIVDPSSVSQNQIKADLINYLNSAPDSAKWKDFFASSVGQIEIELMSGLGAYLNYNIITARREAFLQYVQNRSSGIAGAQTQGYSTFRGRNQVVDVTFIPNTTGTLSKWTVIGVIKDQDLILLNDTVVNTGVQITAQCIVGLVGTQSVTATSTAPSLFRYNQRGVSTDIRLFLDSNEVQLSDKILDLIVPKFVAATNVYESVDISYLNLDTYSVRYNIGSVLELRWIGLTSSSFSFLATDIKFTAGTFVSFSTVSLIQPPELLDSIKINAPLSNETKFVIRGRKDYEKIFRLLNPTIVDSKGEDVSPAVVRLIYVRNDISIFSDAQKASFQASLEANRPFGVQPSIIANPAINFLNLLITIKLLPDVGTVNPTLDINAILDSFRKNLGVTISFNDLERLINNLEYIKISRLEFNPSTWTLNTNYRRGRNVTPVSPGNFIFEMLRKVYKSANTEPTWPTVAGPNFDDNLGDLIVDGEIVWEVIIKPCGTIPTWLANHDYVLDDVVIPTGVVSDPSLTNKAFKVVDFINKSGADINFTYASNVYSGVTFTADNGGVNGNNIALVFTGSNSVTSAVNTWNTANPSNTVSFTPLLSGGTIPAAANLQLAGGSGAKANAVYSGVTYTAANFGVEGNLIKLNFNGIKTVQTVVNEWNAAEPTNQVTFDPFGSASLVPPSGTATLTGGASNLVGEPVWPSGGIC